MTIVPINPITVAPIPPFVYPTVTNVQPFTYRDGATFLEILSSLDNYIKQTLIPFIQNGLDAVGDQYTVVANALIANLTSVINDSETSFNDKVTEVNSLIAGFNDAVTAGEQTITDAANNAAATLQVPLDAANAAATAAQNSATGAAGSATAADASATNAGTSATNAAASATNAATSETNAGASATAAETAAASAGASETNAAASAASAHEGIYDIQQLRDGETVVTVAAGADSVYNAFPGFVVCANGDYLAAWRQGATHAESQGVMMVSRSTDWGQTWSVPTALVTIAGTDVRDVGMRLLSDGRIVMQYFTENETTEAALGVFVSYSSDNGVTWTTAIQLPAPILACSGAPIELSDGSLLVAGYANGVSYVTHTSDDGASWSTPVAIASVSGLSFGETGLWIESSGTAIGALVRDTVGVNYYRTVSTDNGGTWSTPMRVAAPGAMSGRPMTLKLSNGAVWVSSRNLAGEGGTHQYALSWDEGLTWGAEIPFGPAVGATVWPVYQQAVEIAHNVIGVAYATQSEAGNATLDYTVIRVPEEQGNPTNVFVAADRFANTATGAKLAQQMVATNAYPPAVYPHGAITRAGAMVELPADWKTYDIEALVTPTTGTGGNVHLAVSYDEYGDNTAMGQGTFANLTPFNVGSTEGTITTAPRMPGVHARNAAVYLLFERSGSSADDTYADSLGFVGLRLYRTS